MPTGQNGRLETNSSRVVYGADDRDEVFDHEDAARVQLATSSVVALFFKNSVDLSDPNNVAVYSAPLGEYENLCSTERFREQPIAAFCSGTLIAPDLVLTAGHCITSQADCAQTAFAFDFRMEDATTLHPLNSEDIYTCAELVAQHFEENAFGLPDFAIARLDRPATGHTPATVRAEATALDLGTSLWLAGFPSGIPMKITDGAEIVDTGSGTLDQFTADFDTFAGNSGSGVFAEATGELVGVFNSGATDFVSNGSCNVVNVCSQVQGECTGESSTYVFRATEAFCDTGASAPFCACGDGVCAAAEQGNCCADCGCTGDLVCRGNACVANPCSEALAIEPVDSSYTGSMNGASSEFAPAASCSSGDGPDVAYSFTLTGNASLQATASGSDPVLMVMSADACGSGSQLACNDDVTPNTRSSGVALDLAPGSYVVVVDSFEATETGSYSLELDFTDLGGETGGTSGAGGTNGGAGADSGGATSGGTSSGGTSSGGTNSGGRASGGGPSTGGSSATSGGSEGTETTGGRSSTGGRGSTGGTSASGGSPSTTEDSGGAGSANAGSGSTSASGGTAQSAGEAGNGDTESSGGVDRSSGGRDSTSSEGGASGSEHASAGDTASPESDESDSGCGCVVAARAPQRTAWSLALGLLGLGFIRRRSSKNAA